LLPIELRNKKETLSGFSKPHLNDSKISILELLGKWGDFPSAQQSKRKRAPPWVRFHRSAGVLACGFWRRPAASFKRCFFTKQQVAASGPFRASTLTEIKTFLALATVALILTAMHSVADEFNSAGVKIHYAIQGHGNPVILIHGLYSNGRLNWDNPGTTALLAKHFQVITMDCRGHGRSAKPTADDAYGTNMVEDVVRLMDHLDIPHAQVAGYSMGGMISMKLAVTHPNRVSLVVLCGMGWIQAGAKMNSVWDKMDRTRFHVPPACARSFPTFAVTEAEIKAIKIPVDIIIGDSDPCREWYVEPLHQVRPDWPIHIIANAGHINCPTKPEFKTELEAALKKGYDAK
jgi:pimeloyl-ACP methyl ester carboxylesterase